MVTYTTHEGRLKNIVLDKCIIVAVINCPAIHHCDIQWLVEQTTKTMIPESAALLAKNLQKCFSV